MSRSSDAPGARLDPGLVLYVGFDAERPGELSWPALAALEAADAVLYDAAAEPSTLGLIPPRCFAEEAASATVLSRAKKLAGEGWKVVRLVAGDPASQAAGEAGRLAALGIRVRALSSAEGAGSGRLPKPLPQAFSTALNGLAG